MEEVNGTRILTRFLRRGFCTSYKKYASDFGKPGMSSAPTLEDGKKSDLLTKRLVKYDISMRQTAPILLHPGTVGGAGALGCSLPF